MSERVNKLTAQENALILKGIADDEIVYVNSYYYLDATGKRVYDIETMRNEFEENMYNLIDLNKVKHIF
mgnify:CR=1 FL=1